jgi:hypothetical protein
MTDLVSWLLIALGLLLVLAALIHGAKKKRESENRKILADLKRGIPDDFYEKIAEDRAVWQEYLRLHGVFPMASVDMEDTPDVMRELEEIRAAIRHGRASLSTAAGIKAAMTVDDLDSRNFS